MRAVAGFRGSLKLGVKVMAGVLALGMVVGCSTTGTSSRNADGMKYIPKVEGPKQIGRIAYLNAPNGFVLIEVAAGYEPAAGTELKVYDSGETLAVLAVSEQRQRPFISADIRDGSPNVGMPVYQDPVR